MPMNKRPQPITDFLARVAQELRELAGETDHLHCLVDNMDWDNAKDKDELMRSAQSIDSIEQRLSALSDFISALVELAPAHWEVEGHVASQRVKLAKLAARLLDHPHPVSTVHHPGESEFF